MADARKQIGTVVNTLARLMPNADQTLPFDEAALGEANAIDKAAFGLSTQAVHGISARPAQIEWQSARNSVPNNQLPDFSALLLSNTLRLTNQYQKGQYEWELQSYKNGVDPSAAANQYQALNGNRVAGAALAQTYIDMAKARPSDPQSKVVNEFLAIPPEHAADAVSYFDQNFKPLQGGKSINSQAFDVPSFGALIYSLARQ